ncbi:MAG: ABC transporter permease subunit [Candidatus Micrarchaeia archaeon]
MALLIAALIIDTIYSWTRMFIALAFSIIIGLSIGIYVGTNKRAEQILIPIVDILQTLPILTFFPFVIFVVINLIPGSLGINAAVIFLILTSMLWNIIFGVYESIKTLPREVFELADLYGMNLKDRLRKIFIPASMPKVMEQSTLSWAIGLFYLVTSEIFSISSSSYSVKHGIGVALTELAMNGNYVNYIVGLIIFIIFVIITRLFFFAPLEKFFSRFNNVSYKEPKIMQHVENSYKQLVGFFEAHNIISNINRNKKSKSSKKENENIGNIFTRVENNKNMNKKYINLLYFIIPAILLLFIASNIILLQDEIIIIESLLASFARVWFTFLIILLIAVPISIYLIFISKKIEMYITSFQILASIPATVLLPIIVVSLKNAPMHNELVAFVIFFLSGVWYVIFGILSHKSYISNNILEVKKIFGVNRIAAWKKIYLYAIIPGLLTGAVTAIAAEWNASIVAEYFTTSAIGNGSVITSVNIGIGKLLDTALDSGNMVLMLLALLNFTIMIILINKFLWKRFYNKIENIYK